MIFLWLMILMILRKNSFSFNECMKTFLLCEPFPSLDYKEILLTTLSTATQLSNIFARQTSSFSRILLTALVDTFCTVKGKEFSTLEKFQKICNSWEDLALGRKFSTLGRKFCHRLLLDITVKNNSDVFKLWFVICLENKY